MTKTIPILLIIATVIIAKETGDKPSPQPFIRQQEYRMDVNRFDMPLLNDGSAGNGSTAWYPSGQTELSILFEAGLITSGYVNGELRASWMAKASRIEEFQEGPWGVNPDHPLAKWYPVTSRDTVGSQAYLDWVDAVTLGARFVDVNGDNIYDPYVDRPPLLGQESAWTIFNDGVPAELRDLGSDPLGLEVRQTVSAFSNHGPLNDNLIFQMDVKNVSDYDIERLIFGVWLDPDMGNSNDDLRASDTLLQMMYTYNRPTDYDYGDKPPAFGATFLQSARAAAPGNLAAVYTAPHIPIEYIFDSKIMGMTSATTYSGSLGDPDTPQEARNLQVGGFNADGNEEPIYPPFWGMGGLPTDNPRFIFSGNPVTGSGWIDTQLDDARIIINTGPFDLAAGTSQQFIVAYVAARGTNNIDSISKIKTHTAFLQRLFPNGKAVRIAAADTIQPYDTEFSFSPELFEFQEGGEIVSAKWEVEERPDSSSAGIIGSEDFHASLLPDVPGEYTVGLHVSLATGGEQLYDRLRIHAVDAHRPNAHLTITGNQFRINDSAILDGSGTSDPDGNPLQVEWLLPAWTASTVIDSVRRSVTFTKMGNGEISLVASNDYFSDTAAVSVSSEALYYHFVQEDYLPALNDVDNLRIVDGTVYAWRSDDDWYYGIPGDQILHRLDPYNLNDLKSDTLAGTEFYLKDNYVIAYGKARVISIYQRNGADIELIGSINEEVARGRRPGNPDEAYYYTNVYLNYPYLYLPVQEPLSLQVYDISMLPYPDLVGSYNLNPLFEDLGFVNDSIAVYLNGTSFETIDISDPLNPLQISSSPADYWIPRILDIDQNRMIIGWPQFFTHSYVELLDISDISAPDSIAGFSTGDGFSLTPTTGMQLSGNRLMVGRPTESRLFDISEPASPKLIASRLSGYKVKAVQWIGEDLLIVDNAAVQDGGGIYRLRYDSTLVHIEDSAEIPRKFALEQNYPNPFNPTTHFGFRIADFGLVEIRIYDIQGRLIKIVINEDMSPGRHTASWDGTNDFGRPVASGVYFYRLTAINQQPTTNNRFSMARKMILLR